METERALNARGWGYADKRPDAHALAATVVEQLGFGSLEVEEQRASARR